MPNANRARGGVAYYCTPRSRHNYLCRDIDAQIETHMRAIQVDPAYLPNIRKTYLADVSRYTSDAAAQRKTLERRLTKLNEKEVNLWRAFTDHGMRASIYEQLAKECQEERQRVDAMLAAVAAESAHHVADLDAALAVIAQIGERFTKCTPHQQRAILLQMVERVIINRAGRIKQIDWKAPFCYLMPMADPAHGETSQAQKKQTDTTVAVSAAGSFHASVVTPGGLPDHIT